ncbi:hypothetical protein SK128_009932 [Halocaridina rubra]|uniref:Uncharacterized protein n=1 Tax=Halocaridina rubra TaxID=373956 RepID=A0AAN8XHW5_HALRR
MNFSLNCVWKAVETMAQSWTHQKHCHCKTRVPKTHGKLEKETKQVRNLANSYKNKKRKFYSDFSDASIHTEQEVGKPPHELGTKADWKQEFKHMQYSDISKCKGGNVILCQPKTERRLDKNVANTLTSGTEGKVDKAVISNNSNIPRIERLEGKLASKLPCEKNKKQVNNLFSCGEKQADLNREAHFHIIGTNDKQEAKISVARKIEKKKEVFFPDQDIKDKRKKGGTLFSTPRIAGKRKQDTKLFEYKKGLNTNYRGEKWKNKSVLTKSILQTSTYINDKCETDVNVGAVITTNSKLPPKKREWMFDHQVTKKQSAKGLLFPKKQEESCTSFNSCSIRKGHSTCNRVLQKSSKKDDIEVERWCQKQDGMTQLEDQAISVKNNSIFYSGTMKGHLKQEKEPKIQNVFNKVQACKKETKIQATSNTNTFEFLTENEVIQGDSVAAENSIEEVKTSGDVAVVQDLSYESMDGEENGKVVIELPLLNGSGLIKSFKEIIHCQNTILKLLKEYNTNLKIKKDQYISIRDSAFEILQMIQSVLMESQNCCSDVDKEFEPRDKNLCNGEDDSQQGYLVCETDVFKYCENDGFHDRKILQKTEMQNDNVKDLKIRNIFLENSLEIIKVEREAIKASFNAVTCEKKILEKTINQLNDEKEKLKQKYDLKQKALLLEEHMHKLTFFLVKDERSQVEQDRKNEKEPLELLMTKGTEKLIENQKERLVPVLEDNQTLRGDSFVKLQTITRELSETEMCKILINKKSVPGKLRRKLKLLGEIKCQNKTLQHMYKQDTKRADKLLMTNQAQKDEVNLKQQEIARYNKEVKQFSVLRKKEDSVIGNLRKSIQIGEEEYFLKSDNMKCLLEQEKKKVKQLLDSNRDIKNDLDLKQQMITCLLKELEKCKNVIIEKESLITNLEKEVSDHKNNLAQIENSGASLKTDNVKAMEIDKIMNSLLKEKHLEAELGPSAFQLTQKEVHLEKHRLSQTLFNKDIVDAELLNKWKTEREISDRQLAEQIEAHHDVMIERELWHNQGDLRGIQDGLHIRENTEYGIRNEIPNKHLQALRNFHYALIEPHDQLRESQSMPNNSANERIERVQQIFTALDHKDKKVASPSSLLLDDHENVLHGVVSGFGSDMKNTMNNQLNCTALENKPHLQRLGVKIGPLHLQQLEEKIDSSFHFGQRCGLASDSKAKSVTVAVEYGTDENGLSADCKENTYQAQISLLQENWDKEKMASHYFCRKLLGEYETSKEHLELVVKLIQHTVDKQLEKRDRLRDVLHLISQHENEL